MSVSIGELIVNLRASTAAFAKDLDRASQLSFQTAREIERSFKIIGGAAVAAAGAIAGLAERSIEAMDRVNKLSQQTGLSVEQFSGLSYAAKLADVETSTLAKSLVLLSKNLEKSNQQTLEGKAAHSALGTLFRGNIPVFKTTDEALLAISSRFAEMPKDVEKSALAAQIFGKSGAALIPLLNRGADGIEELRKRAAELGVVFSTEAAQAAEKFNDNLKTVKASLEGMSNEIATRLLPRLTVLSQVAAGFAQSGWTKELAEAFKNIGKDLFVRDGADMAFSHLADQLVRLHAAGADAAKALEKDQEAARIAAEKAAAAAAAHDKLRNALTAVVSKLKENIAVAGQGAIAHELYRLSVLGATETQLRWVQALNTTSTFYEAANRKIYGLIKFSDEYHRTLAQQIADQRLAAELADKAATAALTASLGVGKGLQAIFDRGIKGAEDLTGHFEAMKPKLSALGEAAQSFGEHMGQSFESAIVRGKNFGDVMQQLLRDLEAVILKTFVWQGLFNATKGLTGIGGFFNSIFKGLGGFAAGGSVDSGTPIVVGEQGPEVFMPYAAGKIVPNSQLGGSSVVNNYYIDARGADASVEFRIKRAIAESENRAVAKSVVAVKEMSLRTA